jgi:hypothetical protein
MGAIFTLYNLRWDFLAKALLRCVGGGGYGHCPLRCGIGNELFLQNI